MYLCHVPALELVLKLRLALTFVHVCVHVRECSAVFFFVLLVHGLRKLRKHRLTVALEVFGFS